MEPGVETFAIATTIRVLLIKLRHDNNNALLPSFGWEVDLSSHAKVSSAVSDHGHNGCALTITKRAPTSLLDKRQKKALKKQRLAQQKLEKSMRSHASSAESVDSSAFTGDEEELEIDIGEDDASQLDAMVATDDSKPTLGEPSADLAEPTDYHHGATTEHGEVLEWFTVLAEFQHRKQLTRLHNAISCIVGDYDAVIVERLKRSGKKEGTFAFGIFNFESGLPDSRTTQVSNMELVDDLEYLPWMQQTLFERVRMLPANRRKDYLSRIRRTWGYSKDLEASVAIGGPAWLIEARARAMHISREQRASAGSASASASFDMDDDVIREVLKEEMDAGTVNSDNALDLMKRVKALRGEETGSSTIETSRRDNSHRFDLKDDVDDSSGDMLDATIPTTRSSLLRKLPPTMRASNVTTKKDNTGSDSSLPVRDLRRHFHKDSDGDIFFSMRNISQQLDLSDDETDENNDIDHSHDLTLDITGGESEILTDISMTDHTRDKKKPPVTPQQLQEALARRESSATPPNLPREQEQLLPQVSKDSTLYGSAESQSFDSDESLSAANAAVARKYDGRVKFTSSSKQHKKQGHAAAGRSIQSMDVSESSDATSRMDRLEAVMEQLVLLNATQLQQQQQQMVGPRRPPPPPAAGLDQSHHSHSSASAVFEIADTLKNELAEIRSQIKTRAKEDEALRSEISLLRDQLQERSKNNTPDRKKSKKKNKEDESEKKKKKFPVPEISLKTMLPRRLLHDSSHDNDKDGSNKTPMQKKESTDSKSLSSKGKTDKAVVVATNANNQESRSVGWDDSIDFVRGTAAGEEGEGRQPRQQRR